MDHGDDCHFFYNATCAKGEGCVFRHVAEAKQSDVTCEEWRLGRCLRQNCPLRHSEQANYQQSECFFETQPGGCTKMHCAFVHRFPRNVPSPVSSALPIAAAVRPPQISPVPVAAITSQPAGLHGSQPIVVRPGEVPVRWMAPVQPAAPGVWPRGPPPPGAHMFPPGPHPHYGAFPPGVRPPPLHTEPPHFVPGMPPDMAIRPINPIIINPNEESDLEMSPVKQPIMAHISQPPPTASNPLDYFLNAKPYVAPNPPRFHSRSPSPTGRMSPYRKRGSPTRSQSPSGRVSPYRKRGSVSPERRSPRRSLSPVPRRQSGSMERYEDGLRRRSGSLDRSGSPDRRDRRRFVRRSRSPPRRRSRSPVGQERTRGRAQGILNRFRGGPKRGPKLEEVKVSGRKIVSLKKDKKEEDTDTQQKEETKQETSKDNTNKGEAVVAAAEKSGAGSSSGAGGAVVEEEVKSLEEIYRERALLSMMDAKRKRIQDAKRKRWEGVKDSGDRKSESEKSDKSDKAKTNKKDEGETGESEHSTEEKADNSASEKDSSSEGEDDNAGSDIDFNQDVDIELGEGDIIPEPDDQENTQESDHPDTDNSEKITQDQKPKSKHVKPSKSKVSDTKSGQGIKSRLGLRRNDKDTKQRETIRSRSERHIGAKTDKPRSIKDRLGLKPPVTDNSDRNNSSAHDSDSEYDRDSGHDRPVRSGVIKLNKKSSGSNKTNSIFSRLKINREVQAENRRTQNVKNILMVPQITIRNKVEDRKSDIRQRLGLLGEEGSDSDSRKDRKRRRGLDEELLRLLDEEDTSIDYDDLKLLSKKEKKKVLKKLLAQQGREDEYEIITGKKKKKRGFKKRKNKQEDEGESREKRRRINITDRLAAPPVAELDEGSEDEVLDDLQSGDEIQLAEADPPSKESSREPSPHRESDDNKSSEEDAADTVDIHQEEQTTVLEIVETDSKQTKAEKAAQLRKALQPKSIQDIRRERAVKKAQGEEVRKIQISTGPSKRKIIIAGEEKKVVEKSEPPVRITFGGFDAAPRRKLSRLADTIDNTDSMKLGRRQRQIYVPPMKKSDEPVAKKPLKVTQGREIIDYSDMFPKKSTSVSDLNIKKITTKATPAQPDTDSTRAPVRLNRGPPKVEVKDATVKTFTEIMAEKKRKRLEAQQAANKPAYKPIVFDDQDASNDSTQGSKPHITSATEERLSPIKSQHSSIESTFNPVKSTSSPVKASPVKATTDLRVNLKKTNSSNSLNPSTDPTVKPTRWKRKKLSEQNVAADVNISSKADLQSANVTSGSETFSVTSKAVSDSRLDKVEDPQPTVHKETSLTSKTPPESQTSTHEPAEIDAGPVKKARISDSFLDFDDDLLKLDDDDDELELDADQDHDELMREIDELLA